MRSAVFAFAAILAACASDSAPGAPAPQATELGVRQTGLDIVNLVIQSGNGSHRFTVEVARTVAQQRHGMMFRTEVPPNKGMLFPFKPPHVVGFWMRDTPIPLDIIFIRPDRTIARIRTAKPLDETLLLSGEQVSAVLEIAGGRAAQLGIVEGDRVEWGS